MPPKAVSAQDWDAVWVPASVKREETEQWVKRGRLAQKKEEEGAQKNGGGAEVTDEGTEGWNDKIKNKGNGC